MAYASDRLKARRMKKMDGAPMEDKTSEDSSRRPSDRSLQLTDHEMKALAGSYQPGEEAQCLVTGRIDAGGMLDVINVEPAGGGEMAQQSSPIVQTNPAISPS